MKLSYQFLRRKLSAQMRINRNRSVREKIELFYLVAKLGNVSEACARRGVSREFFYKWIRRLKQYGYDLDRMADHSRRPKRSPKQIPKLIESRIWFYWCRNYGSRMTQHMLRKEGIRVSRSTICHVWNRREKVIRPRRWQKLVHRRRYELLIPGQRFQMDVKYVPDPVCGMQVYSYVAVDECTRWRYARAYSHLDSKSTVDFLDRLHRATPFPIACIQTDRGQEFTNKRKNSPKNEDHPMDKWCHSHSIRHRVLPPGEKELNGKVERSHRIDEQYFYWKAPRLCLGDFNAAFERWLWLYNSARPHGGIQYLTPMEKLHERLETLKNMSLGPKYDFLRLRFLRETPMRITREGRTLLDLETELKRLYLAS